MLENYLKNAISKIFFIAPTTSKEVEDAISTLDNGKSSGPKNVPTIILKKIKNTSQPLSAIINKSFESGIFPRIFETARVIPVFKSKSRLFSNNIDQFSCSQT